MSIASDLAPSEGAIPTRDARRTLAAGEVNHALHDGYTDLTYVLLPVWQGEFGLGYAALALLRTLYSGTLAALQIPSGRLAQALGPRTVLVFGTLLSAAGYALAGASGSLLGLCAALAIGGVGSSTQHPLALAVIARAYGRGARGPLGTCNFAGDLGKAAVPPLVGFLLMVSTLRTALGLIAGLGVAVALGVACVLPRDLARCRGQRGEAARTASHHANAAKGRAPFALLVAIGMLDNAARPAFLLYLPFLLEAKGAALTTVGLALSLVFVGGALGKAACGHLGHRLGVTRTVILTEAGAAAAVLAVIALPLAPALALLPALGVMLNGTSSVLYGTAPDLAPNGRVERAFAVFQTCTLGGSALAAPLFYGRLGDAVEPGWAAVAAAATALAVVPIMLVLAPSLALHGPANA